MNRSIKITFVRTRRCVLDEILEFDREAEKYILGETR